MNNPIFLVSLLLLMLIGTAGATTPIVPSNIQYYVPITITNSQSAATSSPFQQMINITESDYSSYISYSGNEANFEYFSSNGAIIPAWIESNNSGKLITWVKLASGIPANSKVTLYLGFASKTTNLLSSSGTSGIGEAPQLSSTYAEYDDGASVFNNYWNFAGTSLPSGWVNENDGYGKVTVDDGITVSNGANAGTNLASSTPNIIEGYVNPQKGVSGTAKFDAQSVSWGSSGSYYQPYIYKNRRFVFYSPKEPLNAYNIYGMANNGADAWWYFNDVQVQTQTTTASKPDEIRLGYGGSAGGTISAYWIRIRTYPPNGVMPSVSFGPVQKVSIPTLTISPNPVTYGNSVTITATCPISTDTCAIDYPTLGTEIAKGIGSATYTWNTINKGGVGTFSKFYADDISRDKNSSAYSLTVTKATPTINLGVCKNYIHDGSGCTVTASISSISNQITGDLYVNGVSVGSTNSIITYTTSPNVGNYIIKFDTTGNANYTSNTITKSFTISSKATPSLYLKVCKNYKYDGSGCTVTASISSASNQLTGDLYVNGVSVGSTNSIITYSQCKYKGI